MTFLDMAWQNLSSPMILFFLLGLLASIARSDFTIPEAIGKLLAIYLLMAIGFRGGSEIAHHGIDRKLFAAIVAGIALSFATPFFAYVVLRSISRFRPVDAAAVAAHYGSISIVTFIAASSAVARLSLPYEGFMVGVAAAMETPAILAGLMIASQHRPADSTSNTMWREVFLNGSVVVLAGAFVIGIVTGDRGASAMKPFVFDLFPGFLCLFLLDMGLIVGRGLEQGRKYLSAPAILFGVCLPLLSAVVALIVASTIGLSVGGIALMMTLAASASYIAVPAALRLALPQANPAIGLTMSLGITFPFNLTVGIPLYIVMAQNFSGWGLK